MDEICEKSILINDYTKIIEKSGWDIFYIIQSPMSPEPFQGAVAAEMQKRKILGVTSRHVIIAKHRL